MRVSNNKKFSDKKNHTIIALAILVLMISSYAVYATLYPRNPVYTAQGNPTQKNSTQRSNETPTDKDQQPASQDGRDGNSTNTMTPTVAPDPALDADFPIENSHYRISKTGEKSFDVNLYAISNSPSQYDEYVSQLKQYKTEVLDYLKARYGDTSTFNINWTPPQARDL